MKQEGKLEVTNDSAPPRETLGIWHRPAFYLLLASAIFNNTLPITVIKGTTNALPMVKYRNDSGIPVFVQLSGNPLMRSHSTGVNMRVSLVVCAILIISYD